MPGRFLTHYTGAAVNAFRAWYRRSLAQELRKHGLYVDDVVVETPEIKVALKMMPKHEVHLRDMRLLRANDLTIKHAELPLEQQRYDPLHSYLQPYLKQVLAIRQEISTYDANKSKQYSRAWHLINTARSFVLRKEKPARYVDKFLCTKYPYFDEWDKPWFKLPSSSQSGGRPLDHAELSSILQKADKTAKVDLARQGFKPKMSEEQRARHL